MTLLLPAFTGANHIYYTDAISLMRSLGDKSVDAFITDLPYGTTACRWDEIIPFAPMWAEVKRTLKPGGVFVTTASDPFALRLKMSNFDWFKYSWIWIKNNATGFNHASNMPLKNFEEVCVFSGAAIGHDHLLDNRMNYNPQGLIPYGKLNRRASKGFDGTMERASQTNVFTTEFTNYPRMALYFNGEADTCHPTQKPVALYEYLISTYTRSGELVVDFCCGSGTTCLAARNLERRFISGDITPEYVEVARKRLAMPFTPQLFSFDPVGQHELEASLS